MNAHAADAIFIANWLSLYAATAVLAAIACVLAAATVGCELIRERAWREVRDLRSAFLFAPNIWWRWQRRYLLASPVILAIIGGFAAWLPWSAPL